MKCYLIWAIQLPAETDTTDRDRYKSQLPNAPRYPPFHLFPATTGEISAMSCDIMDLSGSKLVETVNNPKTEMTFVAFDELAHQLINEGFTGRCIVLSVQQGQYLHRTRYAPSSTNPD